LKIPYRDKKKQRDYMKTYMRDYRKMEREAIKEARRMLGLSTRVRKTQKQTNPKKKRRKVK